MIRLPSDPSEQLKFLELGRMRFECETALKELSAALRLVNRQASQLKRRSRQPLVECLDAANRALANLSRILQLQDQLIRRVHCPVCNGEGEVTQRGIIQRRVWCSACRGTGDTEVPPHPQEAVGGPLGKCQRMLLHQLLNLGGANWPIPIGQLGGGTARRPAARAARSRALRQLENRGLVRRSHARKSFGLAPVRRASQAQLTAAGRELALTLTKPTKR